MRNFAICGSRIPPAYALEPSFATVCVDGGDVACGIVESGEPAFDRGGEHAHFVVVRVHAFSCNYRDKSFVVRAAKHMPENRYFVIGSEFAGEVVEVGARVQRVRAGDHVIADNAYPDFFFRRGMSRDTPIGIPTNHASGELLVVHEEHLMRIPSAMPYDVAAAFSLNGQTAFSIVEKLALRGGEHVLITAARSNASLYTIEALRQHDVTVYATTSSARHVDQLRARGVRDVFVIAPGTPFVDNEALAETARTIGGFSGVVDPFLDLHLLKAMPLMRNGARYVSCGEHDQNGLQPHAPGEQRPSYSHALSTAIIRNIALIGNCLGKRHHLEQALRAYEAGSIDVPLDSVHRNGHAGAFLTRTYVAPDRFGKVVYAYN
jgi:NADPH:quinone reductase-like Zn-dependent oxidoreductase